MNYCKKCGKIIEDNIGKCPFCGAEINNSNATYAIEEKIFKEKDNQYIDAGSKVIERSISDDSYEEVFKGHTKMSRKVNDNNYKVEPLNNWVKVTLSILILLIPVIGSIIDIIVAIVFMNNEDEDRKSFGYALLTYSIIFLVIFFVCCLLYSLDDVEMWL
ncbi:C2HC5-type zinc finger protein [Defluviitalea phaphyphila]|uniref:zinc ribbon domain-containing protein n=1 Tax=Defluviitalea phaphyphila TaxID=1473580 RepID=UPI00072FE66C|nr:zinc ribbon domain-containing protein [Defluviitalea phaphyphila]